jgi:hypothetical protein
MARFQKEDGWNIQLLEEVGLMELLDDIYRIKYEIENARRNSYAEFGDTGEDLQGALIDIQSRIEDVITEMDYHLEED